MPNEGGVLGYFDHLERSINELQAQLEGYPVSAWGRGVPRQLSRHIDGLAIAQKHFVDYLESTPEGVPPELRVRLLEVSFQ